MVDSTSTSLHLGDVTKSIQDSTSTSLHLGDVTKVMGDSSIVKVIYRFEAFPPLLDDAAAAAAAATAMVTDAVANPCPNEDDSLEVLGSTTSDLW